MLSKLKNSLRANLINYKGWTTNRKIVVFESDDWGAIRLPDIKDFDRYKKIFPDYHGNPYLRYDSLASEDDLNVLFSLISDCKDNFGNHPKLTFNTVVANPDFKKIKESGYKKYYYEPFTETLKRFSNHSKSFDLWKKAIDEKLMYPQFHGREHVNVPLWLEELRNGNQELLNAFDLGVWSVPENKSSKINLQASLDWIIDQPILYQKDFISEGLREFETVFGFSSTTMIPNNYILDPNLNTILIESGIKGLQGMKYQKLPLGKYPNSKRKMMRRYNGNRNESGLFHLVRNCVFEPSQTPDNYYDVAMCLQNIDNAFFWSKPAIIDTHRLNYIGTYDKNNRETNLIKLKLLINQIILKWKEVEFMSSNELLDLILIDITSNDSNSQQ
jgi:hypothetical protein